MPSITVKGMSCDHCRKAVTEAVAQVAGVVSVTVDLQGGTAAWTDADPVSPASVQAVRDAVKRVGFEAE